MDLFTEMISCHALVRAAEKNLEVETFTAVVKGFHKLANLKGMSELEEQVAKFKIPEGSLSEYSDFFLEMLKK